MKMRGDPSKLRLQSLQTSKTREEMEAAGKSGVDAAKGEAHWLESANHWERKQWPSMTPEEKDLIGRLHHLLGDRWELIAPRLPTRTAEEVEIYWRMEKKRKYHEEEKIYKPVCTRLCRTRFNPRLCRTRFNPTSKFAMDMDEPSEETKPSQTGA